MIDDAELLRCYVEERSEEAFTLLVERHLGLVFHSALRQLGGDSHLAQDVAQTVFILLAEKAGSLRGHPNLVGWLYTTTHFKSAKASESERRRRAREQAAYAMREVVTDAEPLADWERIRPILDEAVLELSEEDRTAVLLRFLEGRPFADIAASLHLTQSNAYKRVERALEKLRARLSRRGITSSTAVLSAILTSQSGLAAPVELTSSVVVAAMASPGPAASISTGVEVLTMTKATALTAALVGIAGAVGFFSIGAGIYQLREVGRAERSLQSVNRQYAAEEERLQALAQRAEAAGKTVARLKKPADPKADGQRFMAAHPEARKLLFNSIVRQIRRSYGLFYRRAGLTPAQIKAFEEAATAYSLQNVEIFPGGGSLETFKTIPDAQLRAALGEQAFQQFKSYTQKMPASDLATNIFVAAAGAAAPLSIDQTKQLAQIFSDNNQAFENGGPMNLASEHWANAEAQTQTILSATQWEAAESVFFGMERWQAANRASGQ